MQTTPSKLARPLAFAVFAAALATGAHSSALATEIEVIANTNSCALNEVLLIQVKVTNPTQATTPTPEPSAEFAIRLAPDYANPATSNNMSMVNGRVVTSETNYTYTFEVRPTREGRLTLPAFTLKDGGQVYTTQPIPIKVGGSDGAGGKGDVYCKVITPRDYAYLGEPLQLRLEIFVKQYKQDGLTPLDMNVMYRLCQMNACQFGVFADAVTNTPSVRTAKIRGDRGILEDYFIYFWDATIYPKNVGPFDYGAIVIAWQYPTWLTRSFMGLEHGRNPRNLRVSPELPSLEIKPIPLDGRPPDYNGAVGKYEFSITASPLEVPVGDPITLTLVIRGDGPMDRLSPPKLDKVDVLTKDFEISGESLAGDITIERKIFSQTVRALREDVKQLPALPFSFFNPETERYETAWSKPIFLKVTPAQRVALPNDIGGNSAAQTLKPLVETTEGLRANHSNTANLLANHAGGFGTLPIIVIAIMPGVYLITWLVTRRSTRFREDPALRRRRFAHAVARKALARAAGQNSSSAVAAALLTYVADHCNAPAAGLTRTDAISLLGARECQPELLHELNRLLEELEMASYAGASGISVDDARTRAQHLIDAMERIDR